MVVVKHTSLRSHPSTLGANRGTEFAVVCMVYWSSLSPHIMLATSNMRSWYFQRLPRSAVTGDGGMILGHYYPVQRKAPCLWCFTIHCYICFQFTTTHVIPSRVATGVRTTSNLDVADTPMATRNVPRFRQERVHLSFFRPSLATVRTLCLGMPRQVGQHEVFLTYGFFVRCGRGTFPRQGTNGTGATQGQSQVRRANRSWMGIASCVPFAMIDVMLPLIRPALPLLSLLLQGLRDGSKLAPGYASSPPD